MRHPTANSPDRRHRSLATLLALVTAPLAACSGGTLVDLAAESQASGAIIDGHQASHAEVSATVGLLGNFVCTGTLIAPRVVLTAAHCVVDGVNGVDVYAGVTSQNQANNNDRYNIAQSIPHPEYNAYAWGNDPDGLALSNDIAVLILSEDVTDVVPVPILPFSRVDTDMPAQTQVTLAGFGQTNSFGGQTGTLYVTQTPYVRRSETEMLAGGRNLPDSCNGDSGGPVYLDVGGERFVVGVTSRAAASSQQNCGDGGIYTLAPAFIDWINQSTGGLIDGTTPPPSPEGEPDASPEGNPEGDPDLGSCLDRCGTFDENATCNCDFECAQYDDCCPDAVDICIHGIIPEPEAQPEPTPEPQPDTSEPDVVQPDVSEPESAEPSAPAPEASEPEAAQPDATEPEAAPPDDPGATIGEEVGTPEASTPEEEPQFDGRSNLVDDRPQVASSCAQTSPAGAFPLLGLVMLLGLTRRRRRHR